MHELQGKLPPDVCARVVARLRDLHRAAEQSEVAARSSYDEVAHLKGNCAAEEQMRVSLLEKLGPLEVTSSKLRRELARVEAEVGAAKEAKRTINEEIERLNGDLFAEAGKLVEEELAGTRALKEREVHVLAEFERLKSMMLLQKDRCVVCANLVRDIPLSGGLLPVSGLLSTDWEEGVRTKSPTNEEGDGNINWRKSSI